HNDSQFGAHSVWTFTSTQAGFSGRNLALLNTGQGSWVEILDVTDPVHMQLVGAVNSFGLSDACDGTHWFGSFGCCNLVTVDVSDPTLPVELGNTFVGGYAAGTALSADATRVYQTVWER